MTRFIPKRFAENSTTNVVFGSFQEQGGHVGDGTISNDPATLQGGAAWPIGWGAATDNFFKIPRGEEMDGVNRVITDAIVQQFTDGLTFWQSEMPVTQYQTIVQYQTGSDLPKLYINITGTSTSTPPDSDTTNWYMFLDTAKARANVDLSNLTATGEAHFADPNLSNLTAAGKVKSANLSAPSSSRTALTVLSTGNTYTMTANGRLYARATTVANMFSQIVLERATNVGARCVKTASSPATGMNCFIDVSAGDEITFNYEGVTNIYLTFEKSNGEV